MVSDSYQKSYDPGFFKTAVGHVVEVHAGVRGRAGFGVNVEVGYDKVGVGIANLNPVPVTTVDVPSLDRVRIRTGATASSDAVIDSESPVSVYQYGSMRLMV